MIQAATLVMASGPQHQSISQADPGFLTSNWETLAVPLTVGCVALLLYRYLFDEEKVSKRKSRKKRRHSKSPKKRSRIQADSAVTDDILPLDMKTEQTILREIPQELLQTQNLDDSFQLTQSAQMVLSDFAEIDGTTVHETQVVQTDTVESDEDEDKKIDDSETYSFDEMGELKVNEKDFTLLESDDAPPQPVIDSIATPTVDDKNVDISERFENADECYRCNEKFSMFSRRHHCRKCYRSVCHSCSPTTMNLIELSKDQLYRVCDPCVNLLREL